MNLKKKTFLLLIPAVLLSVAFYLHSKPSALVRLAPYPFKIEFAEESDTEIAFYEKRKLQKISAIELSILAGLYFEKAKSEGNPELMGEAERNAWLSLEKMPVPNSSATLVLARVAEYRHDFKQAISLVNGILASEPATVGALKVALTSYLALGDLYQAEIFATRLIDIAPSPGNFVLSGLVAAAGGKDQIAEDFFVSALQRELGTNVKDSAWSRCMIARFLIERDRHAEAAEFLQEALRISPDGALAYSLLGESDLRQKRYATASEHFQKAFEISKQSVFLIGYGRAKKALGDEALARQIFGQAERILRRDLEQSVGHRLELATLLLERGDPVDASEALELAETEAELRSTSQIYFTLAKAYAAGSDWSSANQAMTEAMASGVKNVEYSDFSEMIRANYEASQRAKESMARLQ